MNMFGSLLIFGLFLCSYGKPTNFGDDVIGFGNATAGQFPYQASVRLFKLHACSATIISKYLILTSDEEMCDFTGGYAVVGIHNLRDKGEATYRLTYDNITIGHGAEGNGGIRVFRVKDEISFSEKVQPIKISSRSVKPGTKAVLSGWTREFIDMEPPMRYMNYTVLSNEECRKKITKFSENNICTAATKDVNEICINDAGAPLVVNGEQIGVMRNPMLCAEWYYNSYVDLHSYYAEINQLINDENAAREKLKEDAAKEEEERKKREEEEKRKREQEKNENSATQAAASLPVAVLTGLFLLSFHTL